MDSSSIRVVMVSDTIKVCFESSLFLASNPSIANEFIAVWLHKGRIVFAFDCGSGKAEIESINHVNDDRWHQIDIYRQGNNATLFIDSHSQGFIIPPGRICSPPSCSNCIILWT